jgi:hypothetical protein
MITLTCTPVVNESILYWIKLQGLGDSSSELDEANFYGSYPPKINVSGTDVRPKEVVLVVLALLVLVLSLCLFFKKVFVSTSIK